jgi:hypothetical protein
MPFQNETIKYIQIKSSGYPEHINQTARYALQNKIKLKATSQQNINKNESFSYRHWIIGGLLIIIISVASIFLKPVAKHLPTLKSFEHKQVIIPTTLTPLSSVSNSNLPSHDSVTKLLPEFHPLKPMSNNPSNMNTNNSLNPIKSIDGKTYTKLNKVQLNSINKIGLLNSNKLTKTNPNISHILE